MMKLSRRTFIKTGVAAAAASVSMPAWSQAIGTNDDIRVAIVGLRWRGADHIVDFRKVPGARVAAICDVDPQILDRELKKLDKDNYKVFSCTDPRKLLDRRDIDAMVIATPNHWHALLTVWSCQAGKDVYVEKPVCHSIWDGRRMIEAGQRYGRIIQSGTQTRSDHGVQQAVDWVRAGNLGKIQWIHALWFKKRESIGLVPPHTPDWLDYDLWCGPSPKAPITRKELHYDWHWMWNTGNGDLGDLGIHEFDVARWFAGHDGRPPRIMSLGGRFVMNDAGQTPNTQLTVFDYPDIPIIVENRNLPMKAGETAMDAVRGIRSGVVVQCEGGHYAGYQGGWAYDKDGKRIKQFVGDGGRDHQKNFIAAMRSRKTSDLRAPIETGYMSTSTCLLGNISYRLGSPADSARAHAAVEKLPFAAETVSRIASHLAANGVDLRQTPLNLGPWLTVDDAQGTIAAVEGGELARARSMLKDEYRAPYVIPDKI